MRFKWQPIEPVARDIPITTTVDGRNIKGTITRLWMNGIEVRVDDGSDRVELMAAPYFQVAIPRLRYTTGDGTLSEHGLAVAVGLLRRMAGASR